MNWPYEVSFAQTLQIPVSVLYFICLFYCFVNWTPEAPYIQASSVYAAVQAQNQIQNFKNQKNKYIKKIQNYTQNTRFQFDSLRFCFFSLRQLSF